jgi:hypothetical protein
VGEETQCHFQVTHGSSGPACEWQAGVRRRGVRCASHGSRAPPSLGRVSFRVRAFPDSARCVGRAIWSLCRVTGPSPDGAELLGPGTGVPARTSLASGPAPDTQWGVEGWGRPRPWAVHEVSWHRPRSPGFPLGAMAVTTSVGQARALGLRVPWICPLLTRPARGSPTHSKGVSVPGPRMQCPTQSCPVSDPSCTVEYQGASSLLPYAPVQRQGS